MKRSVALSIATLYTFALGEAVAQSSADGEASLDANATEVSAAAESGEEEALSTTAAEADSGKRPITDFDPNVGKSTYGSAEIAFGRVYTFGRTGGHRTGIPQGSMLFNAHGFQSDYRRTGLMLSGDTWIDTGYRATETDLPTQSDGNESEFTQQGRFMLRATPTYTHGKWFAKAQGEFLALSDAANNQVVVDVDDAWVKFGYWDLFDIQFGRFEAWEVYHKGMGLERDTLEDQGATPADHDRNVVVDMYEVNHAFYRQGPLGQIALHAYPTDYLRFELEALVGIDVERTTRCPSTSEFRRPVDANGNPTGAVQPRQSCFIPWGVRPAAILDFEWLKLKAAWERVGFVSRQETDAATSTLQRDEVREGFGGGAQFVFYPYLEFGASYAQGYADVYDDLGVFSLTGSVERTTYGGFLNARLDWLSPALKGLVLGGGFNQTDRISQDCGQIAVRNPVTGNPETDAAGSPIYRQGCEQQAHTQYFAAIQHDILERATFKLVFGLADADIKYGPSGTRLDEQTNMFSIRGRAYIWF